MTNGYTKSIPEIVNDLKTELKDFVATRVAMLRSELNANVAKMKSALPLIAVGLVLVITAWFVLTAGLIAAVAMAFATPWNYVIALFIVGFIYVVCGGLMALMGLRQLKQANLKPERTIRVLKQDQIWLQTEAKTQI